MVTKGGKYDDDGNGGEETLSAPVRMLIEKILSLWCGSVMMGRRWANHQGIQNGLEG